MTTDEKKMLRYLSELLYEFAEKWPSVISCPQQFSFDLLAEARKHLGITR